MPFQLVLSDRNRGYYRVPPIPPDLRRPAPSLKILRFMSKGYSWSKLSTSAYGNIPTAGIYRHRIMEQHMALYAASTAVKQQIKLERAVDIINLQSSNGLSAVGRPTNGLTPAGLPVNGITAARTPGRRHGGKK